ncbi:MAG: hypothetical protein ABI741_06090 [Ferruginibacter sp.]
MKTRILLPFILFLLFQNAVAQKVGIGNPNPQYELDVNGNSASNNQVSIIPLWQGGSTYAMSNTLGQDLSNCHAAIDPTLYSTDGNIEVKLVIRITATTATINNFQLRAHNGSVETYPILFSDAWSYSNPQSGIIAISPWKSWAAGTIPLEIHLFGWVDAGTTDFVSAYLMIRPKR